MLRTMLWQGALATLLIGGAAAAYAQARDNGYLAAPRDTVKQDHADRTTPKSRDRDREHAERRHAGREDAHHD